MSKINKNVIDFTNPLRLSPEVSPSHVGKNPANRPSSGTVKQILLDIFSPSLVLYTL